MTVTIEVKPELAHRWKAIAAREGRALDAIISEAMEEHAAVLENSDSLASTRFQEDIYEYSVAELAAMEAGEFERPLR